MTVRFSEIAEYKAEDIAKTQAFAYVCDRCDAKVKLLYGPHYVNRLYFCQACAAKFFRHTKPYYWKGPLAKYVTITYEELGWSPETIAEFKAQHSHPEFVKGGKK